MVLCLEAGSAHFFFLKSHAKDWNKVKQIFFFACDLHEGFWIWGQLITRYYSVLRSGALSRPYSRTALMYYEARLFCKVDYLWQIFRSWNELLCADRKPGNLEETKINSSFFHSCGFNTFRRIMGEKVERKWGCSPISINNIWEEKSSSKQRHQSRKYI